MSSDLKVMTETLQHFLQILNKGKCPQTENVVDSSYLLELLFTPSSQRINILIWILSRIDYDIEKLIQDYQEKHPMSFYNIENSSTLYIFLTDIAASLGLCCIDDVELIRGKSEMKKQISFWERLLSFVNTLDDYEKESIVNEMETTIQKIIHTCHQNQFFSKSMKVVSPVIEKEISILRRSKWTTLKENVSIGRVSDQLDVIQKELKAFQDLEINSPTENLKKEDSAADDRITRSITLLLNDLHQLSIAFNATYDNNLKLFCKTDVPEFSDLGKFAQNINSQLKDFLKLVEGMNSIKTSHKTILSECI